MFDNALLQVINISLNLNWFAISQLDNLSAFLLQVFVGKIPRDVYEDELVPLFSRHGRIYEMRLMMDFNGNNRGYAFVVFSTKKEAQNAVRMLNNYEVSNGRANRYNKFWHRIML